MNNLLHTSKGLNNLRKFHKKIVIYVEGQDDKTFWSYFFESIVGNKFRIKIAPGGVEGLKKYAERVVSENIEIIIASDSHYDLIFDNHIQHQRIVYSYGHSIENTMYCPNNLNKIIKNRCRLDYLPSNTAQLWLEAFCDDLKELLVFDVANIYYGKGKTVMGTTCNKFLKRNDCPNLSKTKINKFLDEINHFFHEHEIDTIKQLIRESEKPFEQIIRGKFLTNGIINLIKQENKKLNPKLKIKTFPKDELYNLTIDGCQSCIKHCESYYKMCQSCTDAIDSLNN